MPRKIGEHVPAGEDFPPIPPERLPRMVGNLVHVSWARRGARWELARVEGDVAHLKARKSGKQLTVKTRDLRYTRRHQPHRYE